MGSEGYLINQFIAQRTNTRSDEWGGSTAGRFRLPVEIVRRYGEEGAGWEVACRHGEAWRGVGRSVKIGWRLGGDVGSGLRLRLRVRLRLRLGGDVSLRRG